MTRPRYFSGNGGGNSVLKPARPAPCFIMWDPRRPGPRTIAEQAEEDDLQLWASSSSVADYDERKQALNERRRIDREAVVNSQGHLYTFPTLPFQLRLMIWKLALEEPMTATLQTSDWRRRPRFPVGCCGIRSIKVEDYSATAILPPLMLVNHESHRIALAHYKRAFRGAKGNGGVLAAYPTILEAQREPYAMIELDEHKLVKEYIRG